MWFFLGPLFFSEDKETHRSCRWSIRYLAEIWLRNAGVSLKRRGSVGDALLLSSDGDGTTVLCSLAGSLYAGDEASGEPHHSIPIKHIQAITAAQNTAKTPHRNYSTLYDFSNSGRTHRWHHVLSAFTLMNHDQINIVIFKAQKEVHALMDITLINFIIKETISQAIESSH